MLTQPYGSHYFRFYQRGHHMDDYLVADLIFWYVLLVISGVVAGVSKGYRTASLLAILLFVPIVAVAIWFMPANQELLDDKAVKDGEKKYCPYCVKAIHHLAIVCAYCQSELEVDKEDTEPAV